MTGVKKTFRAENLIFIWSRRFFSTYTNGRKCKRRISNGLADLFGHSNSFMLILIQRKNQDQPLPIAGNEKENAIRRYLHCLEIHQQNPAIPTKLIGREVCYVRSQLPGKRTWKVTLQAKSKKGCRCSDEKIYDRCIPSPAKENLDNINEPPTINHECGRLYQNNIQQVEIQNDNLWTVRI